MKQAVCILAAQIRKADASISLSDAMSKAWTTVKSTADITVVTFRKVCGDICRRVVSYDWAQYQPPTGTGRAIKEGLVLLADIGKFIAGKPCIISTYKSNIVCG